MTLCINGYQFGRSNHTVYLIDAFRALDPALLGRDWYTTQTLRYHGAFAWLSETLLKFGALEVGFLVGYLSLIVLLHVAWYRLARALGASVVGYLLSVVLYELLAGGTGLGMYRFLQDNCFLPSNVANVAMLWGIYFLIIRRPTPAGAALGIAGAFHLNHALVGIGLYGIAITCNHLATPPRERRMFSDLKRAAPGLLLLFSLALPNIIPAVRVATTQTNKLPLAEFVQLYVRLRHPHHYDPSTWPTAIWVCFFLPIIFAFFHVRRAPKLDDVKTQAVRVVLTLCGLILVALCFAGVWYVSEPLIQMSLWRFGIYVKLIACIGTAMALRAHAPMLLRIAPVLLVALYTGVRLWGGVAGDFATRGTGTVGVFFVLLVLIVVLLQTDFSKRAGLIVSLLVVGLMCGAWGRAVGFDVIPDDSADHLALCDYVREHTPKDALFLVPPDEQSMRLRGLRAVIINFKGVPQLSGEIGQWRDRLQTVLDVPDLRGLPAGFGPTLRAIGQRYDALAPDTLVVNARIFNANYIVTRHAVAFDGLNAPRLVWSSGQAFLYDLRS